MKNTQKRFNEKSNNLGKLVSPFFLSFIFFLTFFVALFYIPFGKGSFKKKAMAGEFTLPIESMAKDFNSDSKVSMNDFGLWLSKYRYYKSNQVLPPVTPLPLSEISTGFSSACGIDSDGKGYCWGNNNRGKLGNGTEVDSNVPVLVSQGERPTGVTFTSISTLYNSACALGSDNNGYCWGFNNYGRLGSGTTGILGNNLPVLVSQGARPAGVTFTSISTGDYNTCGLGSDNNAYCWGRNKQGQLGNGTEVDSNVPVLVSQGERSSGVTFTSISSGSSHTCGLGSDGNGYCWGDNEDGVLGNGTEVDSSVPVLVSQGERSSGVTFTSISTGDYNTCGLGSDNNAYCWGGNIQGQLGNGTEVDSNVPVLVSQGERPAGVTFTSLSVGYLLTCGLGSDGNGYCWGLMGWGHTAVLSNVPVLVSQGERPAGVTFTSLSVGSSEPCALGSDGNGYCWGTNWAGMLGNGSLADSLTPTLVVLEKTADFNNDKKVSMEDFGVWLDTYRRYKSFDQGSYKVVYWPLDESADSDTNDVTNLLYLSLRSPSYNEAIEIVPGKKDGGVIFNNEPGYSLELWVEGNYLDFFKDQDFTLMAYIKKSGDTCGISNFCSIISKGSNGNAGFNFATQNGKLKLYINDTPDVDNKHALGNTTLENNVWYHVAGSYNSEDGSLKVYVNGTLDGSGTNPGPINYTNSYFMIGNANTNYDLQFHGVLDEVRCFDRVLTEEEIASFVLP